MSTTFRSKRIAVQTSEQYREKIERELQEAVEARKQHREGRARVCARRAASVAIAWLYRSQGKDVGENNALHLLNSIQTAPGIPDSVRQASERLSARITTDFRYPFSTDPLDDARIIVEYVKNLLS